ncbi:MAG: glycosyltransferase family 39 protein [Nitrospirae bacterium]|nr:glycosyltransferase family 39 protein [Nitrospirota bacterium]
MKLCAVVQADGVFVCAALQGMLAMPAINVAKGLLLCLVLVFTFWIRVYNNDRSQYSILDESITVKAVEWMRVSGGMDTNWMSSMLIPPNFKQDQYNFSSFIYADYFYYTAHAWLTKDNGDIYKILRGFSAMLGTLAGFFLFLIALRGGGFPAAIITLALYALVPVLVQDSHYVRPESFLTLLGLIAAYLTIINTAVRKRLVFLSAFAVGLACACKATSIILLPVPFAIVFYKNNSTSSKDTNYLLLTGIIFAGIAAGAFVGMPYAFFHIDKFIGGMRTLYAQYSGIHPPHSSLTADSTFGIKNNFLYFFQTIGAPVFIGFVFGAARLFKRRDFVSIIVLLYPIAAYYTFFSAQKVVFERNLSSVVPFYLIIAVSGTLAAVNKISKKYKKIKPLRYKAGVLGLAALVLAIVPLFYTLKLVAYEMGGYGKRDRVQYMNSIVINHNVSAIYSPTLGNSEDIDKLGMALFAEPQDIVFKVFDYNDDYTRFYWGIAVRRFNLEQIGRYDSSFSKIVTSTLYTYHSPNNIYYKAKSTSAIISKIDNTAWRYTGTWSLYNKSIDALPRQYSDYFISSGNQDGNSEGKLSSNPIQVQRPSYLIMFVMTSSNNSSIRLNIRTKGKGMISYKKTPPYGQWNKWVADLGLFVHDEISITADIDKGSSNEWISITQPVIVGLLPK